MTEVKAVPNTVGNKDVVVESDGLDVVTVHLDGLRLPAVVTASVEVQVADLVRARPPYLERVRRAPLERSRTRIVQPRRVNLIPVRVAECQTDLISCVFRRRTARLDCHCVRTRRLVILQQKQTPI